MTRIVLALAAGAALGAAGLGVVSGSRRPDDPPPRLAPAVVEAPTAADPVAAATAQPPAPEEARTPATDASSSATLEVAASPASGVPKIAPGTPEIYHRPYLIGHTPDEILEDGTQIYRGLQVTVRQADGTTRVHSMTVRLGPTDPLPILAGEGAPPPR